MRRSPSSSTGTTGLEPMYPMIPHMTLVPSLALLPRRGRFARCPAVHVRLARAGDSQRSRGHVLGDRRTGSHVGARADGDRRDELRVAADERAILDDGLVLV